MNYFNSFKWYNNCFEMFRISEELILLLNSYRMDVHRIKNRIDTNNESCDPKLLINYKEYLFVFYWYFDICYCSDYVYNFKKYATKFFKHYSDNKEAIGLITDKDLNGLKNDKFNQIWLDLYFNIKKSNYKKRTTSSEITKINNFLTNNEKCFNDLTRIPLINRLSQNETYFDSKPMSLSEYKTFHEKVNSEIFGNISLKKYCEKMTKKIPVIENMTKIKKFLEIHHEQSFECYYFN